MLDVSHSPARPQGVPGRTPDQWADARRIAMSDYPLTPEQEDLLCRLVEAHRRLQGRREPFRYTSNLASRDGHAIFKHSEWPKGSPPVYMIDLEALAVGGYILRTLVSMWEFELTGEAFAYYESLKHPADENSTLKAASKPESGEPGRLSPILVLDEIRGGWKHKEFLAELVGHGQFEGVRHKIGRAQLLLICLLFRSQQVHWIGGQQTTAVTYSEAGKELLKWKKRNHISVCEEDSRHPTHRIGKMWWRFVQQMERDEGLKEMFLSGQTDARGNKLICLRLEPRETQILIKDMSSLLKR
jgi:hypothetical protein